MPNALPTAASLPPHGRIDEAIDEFQLLDDRARPPVIYDDR
jgi:hypothetical protein